MAASPTGPLSGIRVIDVRQNLFRPDGDDDLRRSGRRRVSLDVDHLPPLVYTFWLHPTAQYGQTLRDLVAPRRRECL